MISLKSIAAALWIYASVTNYVESAKILAVFPFPGPSQYICVQSYLKTLATRGHEITSVSAFPQKTPLKNFRDIKIHIEQSHYDETIINGMEQMSVGKLAELQFVQAFAALTSLSVFNNKDFQQLLHSDEQFDLIIIEVLYQDALYALGKHFKAPVIGVSTFGADVVIDQLVDNVSPLAYVPAPSGTNLDVMNFWQRLDNLYTNTMELLYTYLVIIPEQQQYYEKYFPNATLRLTDVRRDFSLLLLNQHYSFSWPRPLVPNAIEVAGMHIDHKPKKLPTDMEAFINASSRGTIYFSLGSNIKSALLPKQKLQEIMNAFASLPVNVLWKFEKTDLADKPKNVFINKWFPQSDVLAHPKVKLFVTHGGMHSLIEAVHHGKPIVGTPVFFDQYLNVEKAVYKGFGVAVNFRNFTSTELRDAILEVLNNPKYTERAQEISASFHDRPMKPLDAAIYWTEYVLRHKGAPQLRVAARHLNFLQRHSVDTMAVLFGIPLLLAIFIIRGVFQVLAAIFRSNDNAHKKRKRD
ncbi:UDP-glucosyltransferase 2-like isoform X3 [Bactrocera neohumeralis]|uniref:UDP-glucosyltransferase 2-like isoform X3 n=1 Tax=Bactrocera neohumeralis TaxID=98809 RepID=UPI002164F88E|nr:UDP-glucosyltransferase 2-like isoform X3 [Bactrocera neohumeralis]